MFWDGGGSGFKWGQVCEVVQASGISLLVLFLFGWTVLACSLEEGQLYLLTPSRATGEGTIVPLDSDRQVRALQLGWVQAVALKVGGLLSRLRSLSLGLLELACKTCG